MIDLFSGVRIMIVEPGTVVGKDDSGADMVVTDEAVVFNGPNAWVTQKVFDMMKAKLGNGK